MYRRLLSQRTVMAVILMLVSASTIYADRIPMRNGDIYEGIIEEIAGGQVRVEINRELMTFDSRDIESMSFDTPHLIDPGNTAMDHFLADLDSQEIVEGFAELDQTASELERLMAQARMYWEAREPIESREIQAWEAARDTFRRPLSRYQEILNDVYFHVLARVDEYNAITREADDIYVGVRGIFQVGSPLLHDGMDELSLRKYVPAAWYDTIFYDGYNSGYDDAYEAIQGEYRRD